MKVSLGQLNHGRFSSQEVVVRSSRVGCGREMVDSFYPAHRRDWSEHPEADPVSLRLIFDCLVRYGSLEQWKVQLE